MARKVVAWTTMAQTNNIYNYSVGDTVFVFVQIRMGVMMEVPTATKMQHVLMVSEVSPVSVTMGLLETVLRVLVSYQ